jgi:hypothetical protein
MKTQHQGKVVAERDEGGWLIMLPDGSVEFRNTRSAAEVLAKAWFAKHVSPDAIGVGEIEWRGDGQ